MVWYKYCLKLFSAVLYQSYCNMFALESMLYTAAEQVCQRIHTESSCSSSWFIIIVIVIVIVVVVIIIIIIIIITIIVIISITNITITIIIIIMKSSSSSSPAGLPPSQLPFSNSPASRATIVAPSYSVQMCQTSGLALDQKHMDLRLDAVAFPQSKKNTFRVQRIIPSNYIQGRISHREFSWFAEAHSSTPPDTKTSSRTFCNRITSRSSETAAASTAVNKHI